MSKQSARGYCRNLWKTKHLFPENGSELNYSSEYTQVLILSGGFLSRSQSLVSKKVFETLFALVRNCIDPKIVIHLCRFIHVLESLQPGDLN